MSPTFPTALQPELVNLGGCEVSWLVYPDKVAYLRLAVKQTKEGAANLNVRITSVTGEVLDSSGSQVVIVDQSVTRESVGLVDKQVDNAIGQDLRLSPQRAVAQVMIDRSKGLNHGGRPQSIDSNASALYFLSLVDRIWRSPKLDHSEQARMTTKKRTNP
jgi:hypothetical protein